MENLFNNNVTQWEFVTRLSDSLISWIVKYLPWSHSLMILVAFHIYDLFEDTLVQDPKGLQKNHFYKTSHKLTWLIKPPIYKWYFKVSTCLLWHLKIISLSFYLLNKCSLNSYSVFSLGNYAPGVNGKIQMVPESQ